MIGPFQLHAALMMVEAHCRRAFLSVGLQHGKSRGGVSATFGFLLRERFFFFLSAASAPC